MKIFKSDNTLLIDVEVNDSSYRFRELMGKDELNMEFSLPVYLEIPLGCHCSFQNQEYELLQPSNVTVKHRREYEYQVLFEASWGRMRRWVVTNSVDGSVEFPLTAKPIEHLNQLVWNLNQRDGEGTWSAGACIDAPEAVISYAFTKCDKALADIATTFNCEWEIVGHTISLHKLEYNKNNPLRLEYGNNKGFRSGVKRTNDGDSLPIGTLYVQGSEKNIDFSSYPSSSEHSKRLLLPRGVTVSFDGEHFSDESGYDSTKAMTFVTDDKGYSVKRINGPHGTNTNEDSIDLSSIYPKRIGTVSAVKYIYDGDSYSYDELIAIAGLDWDKVQIDVIDDSIPASLDYWADDVRIEGETMTMVFQNGMLAGKEFDIQKFYKNADEFRLGNRFEIVRTEIDGICMPNATYRVYGKNEVAGKEATTYVIFNCSLPKSYITEAEKELLREALKFLYVHQDPKFSFTGDLDTMWAKRNWLNVGSRLVIGGYVNFVDQSLAPAPESQDVGVLVRIISVKDYVNNPYCPTIELSTSTQAKSLATSLREVESEYVATDEKIADSIQLSKRSFRNALETSRMLDEALESFKGEFSESVTPITVRTMSLLVGSENLQFKFIKSFTNLTDAPCPIHWDKNAKQLIYDESYLQHITLGVDDIAPKSGRTYDEYYIWRMNSGASAILADEFVHTPFYVYAKVPVYNKATATEAQRVGDFIISKTAIGKDDVTGFHHLLCGTLSSETEGERSFARLYGFTEVLPGQITTDVIRTSDGLAFFDLINKAFKLGDKLKYNVNGDGALVLNGTFVQTGNGDIVKIGAYCGPYESDRIYALGDEVTAEVGSVISSYRYINAVPSRGNPVTDTNYWEVFAKGEKGEKGEKGDSGGQASFKSIVFTRTNSEPDIPTGGSFQHPIPDEIPCEPVWSDGVPSGEAQLWMSTRIFTSDGNLPQQDDWTTPQPATDTADIDFEWSERETVTNPDDDPKGYWHNTATKYDIWMAVRKKKNGIWGSWGVSKIKGENGKDGKGLTQVNEYYQASTSGTTVPLGTWTKNSIPSDFGTSKKFLWNYEEIVYSTGDVTTTSPSVIGVYGKDGKSISSIVEYYQASTSKTTVPTGIWTQGTTPSDFDANKPYLWNYERINYSDGTHDDTEPAMIGHYGKDGKDGDSGQGVFKSFVFKRATSQPSVEGLGGDYLHPVPTGWSDGIPAAGEGEVWMTTRVFTSDGNPPQEPSWTEAQMITDTADIDFEFSSVDGTGFMVKEDLCVSCGLCYDVCPTGAISVGEGGIPRIDKNLCIECGECAGMCAADAIVYVDGPGNPDTDPENWHNEATPEDIWMAVRKKSAGEWGDWEICKIKGEKGTDGVGIRTTEIRYAVGSNGITPPVTGWVENPPPVNAGMYLWTRTIISYTDGTSSTSYSVARQGEPGQRGAALVYRGTYNINPHTGESEVVTYYGTPARVDVVYYPETSKYYVALPTTDEGEEGFRDKEPTNTRYWLEFGASFDSIATGLLFAQEQYVDKLTVRDLKTYERNNLYLQISSEDNCFKVVDSSGKVKLRIDGGSQLFSAYDDDGIEILQISGNEINAIPEDLGLPIRFSVNMNSLKYDGDTATDEMFQSDYCNMKEDSLGLGLSCYLYKDANYSLGNKGARRGKIFGSCSIPNGGRLRMSWVYGKLDITPAPEHSGPGRENGQMAYCRHLEWRISLNGDSILYGDSWSFRGHYPVIGTPLHSDLNIDGAVTVNIDDNEKVASGGTLTITMVFEFYTEYAYYKRFNGGVIPSGVTCPNGWEEYYVDTPYGSFVSGTITPRFSITKIGRNGLYSAWDATKHLFYNHLYGFELLATNNGIRVTADGVYVRLAGTWYKINRGTGYINTDASGSNRRQVAFLELTTQ